MKYKIRFHLAKGKNYLKWQITSPDRKVSYYDPEMVSIEMRGCKLRNFSGVAKRIHSGANKTICAWVEAEEIRITEPQAFFEDMQLDYVCNYNPRVAPHWDYQGKDVDNHRSDVMVTYNRKVVACSTLHAEW